MDKAKKNQLKKVVTWVALAALVAGLTAMPLLAKAQAEADGYTVLLDGTNASDQWDDRPGMKALEELGVLSPLRLCGVTKDEIRHRSREAGLFTWDKPAYACLATRVPTGTEITVELLQKVEKSEEALMKMGYKDLRIRLFSGAARVQLPENHLFP